MPQWKKGQSGNPKGRPKGAKNKATKVKETLEHVIEKAGGRNRLVRMAKDDDRVLLYLIRELVKLEPKEIESTIKDVESLADAIERVNRRKQERLRDQHKDKVEEMSKDAANSI